MKLTSEQIQHLYKFTRQHYVEWYDLQTELVDHLANGIEMRWLENSEISFEEALEKEFKKFGVFGFMEVVEEREKALSKKYLGFIKNQFVNYFLWPQIIKFFSVFSVLFFAMYWVDNKEIVLVSIFISVLCFSGYRIFKLQKVFKKRQKLSGKKWLLEQQIFSIGGFISAMILPFNSIFQLRIFELFSWSMHVILLVSFLLTLYLFLTYIILFKIPANAEKHLSEMYPEYGIA